MKYINLINEFWRMNRDEAFRPLDAMIYLYLLNQCNLHHWQNPLTISSRHIEIAFGITNKTVSEVRKRLQKRGLLTFECRRNNPMILTLTHVERSAREESGKNQSKNQGLYPEGIATDDIRDKRIEKRDLKKHSVECKKSEHISDCDKCEDIPEKNNSERYLAFLGWVGDNAPYVAGHLKPLTEPEFDRLIKKFGAECLARNIDNLENRRDLRRRYTSLYRTLLNWCAKDPLSK